MRIVKYPRVGHDAEKLTQTEYGNSPTLIPVRKLSYTPSGGFVLRELLSMGVYENIRVYGDH